MLGSPLELSWWVLGMSMPFFCSVCGSQNGRKNHLRLMFEREGGGGGGRRVETAENNTSGSRLNAREVAVVAGDRNVRKTPAPARI